MVFVTKAARKDIEQECLRNNSETGGILVGPAGSDIITGFIPSSQAAHRSFAAYEQTQEDVDHLNRELRICQAEGEEFQGYAHWHPNQMNQLSSVDLLTAETVLRAPSYNLHGRLLMLVVTDRRGCWHSGKREFTFYFYEVIEPMTGPLVCQLAEYEEIDDDDPRIQEEKAKALDGQRWMKHVDKGDGSGSKWGFLWTESGQKVLAHELKELRGAGHDAELAIVDNAACVMIQLPEDRMMAVFLAGEYPMAPPRFFLLKANGSQTEVIFSKFRRWSSLFSIKELMDDLKARKPRIWQGG
jgi:hypothetical protein